MRLPRYLIACACLLTSMLVQAQPFPNKPVRIVIGFTPAT